jgi:hypothetical protein
MAHPTPMVRSPSKARASFVVPRVTGSGGMLEEAHEASAEQVLLSSMRGQMTLDHLHDLFKLLCEKQRSQSVRAGLTDSLTSVRPSTLRARTTLHVAGWLWFLRHFPQGEPIVPARVSLQKVRTVFSANVAVLKHAKADAASELKFAHFMEALLDVAASAYPSADMKEAVDLLVRAVIVPAYTALMGEEPSLDEDEPRSESTSVVSATHSPSRLVHTSDGPMSRTEALKRGLSISGEIRSRAVRENSTSGRRSFAVKDTSSSSLAATHHRSPLARQDTPAAGLLMPKEESRPSFPTERSSPDRPPSPPTRSTPDRPPSPAIRDGRPPSPPVGADSRQWMVDRAKRGSIHSPSARAASTIETCIVKALEAGAIKINMPEGVALVTAVNNILEALEDAAQRNRELRVRVEELVTAQKVLRAQLANS